MGKGQGTYLKEYIEPLGFEDRLRFLHRISAITMELHTQDKPIKIAKVKVDIVDQTLELILYLPNIKRFTTGFFDTWVPGAILYKLVLHYKDPNVRTESTYFDVKP